MAASNIVVLGAGVIGLTIAHVLSTDPSLHITVLARDLPDDLSSQAWASPWAGANWSPMGPSYEERVYRWESHTFNKLWDLIPAGLAMELPSRVYLSDFEPEDVSKVWWKDLVRNFRVLPAESVPPNYKSGLTFSTVSVNPKFYLPWLKSELDARGVQFIRKYVASLEDAAMYGDVVINATALGAKSLIGVEDLQVFPIRGQTILVRCPELNTFSCVIDSKVPPDEGTYIISRPGDGSSILGGTYFDDVWDTSIDYSVAENIFARCAELAPVLKSPQTQILAHQVGLRPGRRGGARVEAQWVDLPLTGHLVPSKSSTPKKQLVIHAYGLGAAGYQRSWGVAEEVATILRESLL